jgi:hypothetical protein
VADLGVHEAGPVIPVRVPWSCSACGIEGATFVEAEVSGGAVVETDEGWRMSYDAEVSQEIFDDMLAAIRAQHAERSPRCVVDPTRGDDDAA